MRWFAIFPLAAAVVAGAFTRRLWQAARHRSSVALLAWSFALLQYAVASGLLAFGVAAGWGPVAYRLYYLLGAIWNITWLAIGTIWLLVPRLGAQILTGCIAAFLMMAAFAVFQVPLLPSAAAALEDALPKAGEILPRGVRTLSRYASIGGSIVVLAGLGWSVVRRRRASVGLGLLGLGVVIVGVASELGRAGFLVPFTVGLALGVWVMYSGFLRSSRRPAPERAQASRAPDS